MARTCFPRDFPSQFGDVPGHRVVDKELRVQVVIPEGNGEVFAIHSGCPGCMVCPLAESEVLQAVDGG